MCTTSTSPRPRSGTTINGWKDTVNLDNGSRAAFQVKVGDRVLFTSYAGSEVNVNGTDYLIVTEDDLLAIVD